MKTEMRHALAREPYEEKIRKVAQLVRLAKEFPREHREPTDGTVSTAAANEGIIISAIRDLIVLEFVYNGQPRIVEPQTYGISTAGHPILRAYQRGASGQARGLRLFDLGKVSCLRKATERFSKARPGHNPNDSAMKEVIATLSFPERR
jgi:hypothetical protein